MKRLVEIDVVKGRMQDASSALQVSLEDIFTKMWIVPVNLLSDIGTVDSSCIVSYLSIQLSSSVIYCNYLQIYHPQDS